MPVSLNPWKQLAWAVALAASLLACSDEAPSDSDSDDEETPTPTRDAGRDAGPLDGATRDGGGSSTKDAGLDASRGRDSSVLEAGASDARAPEDDGGGGTTDASGLDATLGRPDAGGDASARGDAALAGDGGAGAMSFFITSVGLPTGGNLGGLAGADAHCEALAAAVGAGGRTWRAYLSTSGSEPVHARDRIGTGPWFNQQGTKIASDVAELHAEAGTRNALNLANGLDEKGAQVPVMNPNEHDILTGSTSEGMALPATPDRTCQNWTSAASGTVGVQVGHHNKTGGGAMPMSWNSAHANTMGCSLANLRATGGAGRFYCFASD